MTGIGNIFERSIKRDGRTIRVADLVAVFDQLAGRLPAQPSAPKEREACPLCKGHGRLRKPGVKMRDLYT